MLKAVFLDIDNTLLSFDQYVQTAMRDGFVRFGLKPYEDWMFPVFERVNTGLWQEIEKETLTFERLKQIRWNHIFAELGVEFDGTVFEAYFRDCLFESAIPEPGAPELLEYLSGKYLLCTASNGPYLQQVNRLRLAGMEKYFSHIFVSEEVGAPKPSGDFFKICFERLHGSGYPDLLPEESIMIGDSLTSDIRGGIDYGMKTCFYNRKKKEIPAGFLIDYQVSSLDEICRFL